MPTVKEQVSNLEPFGLLAFGRPIGRPKYALDEHGRRPGADGQRAWVGKPRGDLFRVATPSASGDVLDRASGQVRSGEGLPRHIAEPSWTQPRAPVTSDRGRGGNRLPAWRVVAP